MRIMLRDRHITQTLEESFARCCFVDLPWTSPHRFWAERRADQWSSTQLLVRATRTSSFL